METTFRIILTLIFVFFGLAVSYAQKEPVRDSARYSDCDLQLKNSNWLSEIKEEKSDAEKIAKIKTKIEFDATYQVEDKLIGYVCALGNDEIKDKEKRCNGQKILFLLYSKNKRPKRPKKAIILDLNKNPEYQTIVKNLNENNVSFTIIDFPYATSLYGSRGASDVVILSTENKEFIKLIKKTVRKTRHNSYL
jgi:hypothetical protein